jgi:leucyl-tRNA synthetase
VQNASQKNPNVKTPMSNQIPNPKSQIRRTLHRTIKKVTEDIEGLQYNTAISALMILLNEFEADESAVTQEDVNIFLKLLAPFAPHVSEELWQSKFQPAYSAEAAASAGLLRRSSYGCEGRTKVEPSSKFCSIHREPWPKHNPKLIRQDRFELVIQVNGKVRGRLTLPMDAGEAEAKKTALAMPQIKKFAGITPRKIIFIPNKLINFVV